MGQKSQEASERLVQCEETRAVRDQYPLSGQPEPMAEEIFDGKIASGDDTGEANIRGILLELKYVIAMYSYIRKNWIS